MKEYLERRLSEGESLEAKSGIIATSPSQAEKSSRLRIHDQSPFLRTTKIGDEIRKATRAVGLQWRPYVFRTYFDTALMLAESKGLMSHGYQQFWMGHKGDIEAEYTTNRNKLPDRVIEDMRSAYGKVQELLQTKKFAGINEEKVRRTLQEQLLLVAGFKKEEIEKMDLAGMSDEEVQQAASQKWLGRMVNNGSKQKVIPINEVESHLTQGWEFVAALPDNKAILKIPF